MMRTRNFVLPAFLLLGSLAVALQGCNTDTLLSPETLAPPLGLRSITGDGTVTLMWEASNYGESRKGFQIFQAAGSLAANPPNDIPAAFGTTPVATIPTTTSAGSFSVDVSTLSNGTTYSFLVVAYKNDGTSLTDLSNPSNIVTDTPRIETPTALTMMNGGSNPRYLDVNTRTVSATLTTAMDVQCQSFNAGAGNRAGIVALNGARLADLGFHGSFDEVDKAPLFSEAAYVASTFSLTVKNGYAFAVHTADNHYAKIWITSVNESTFDFTCLVAFQDQANNPELAPGRTTIER